MAIKTWREGWRVWGSGMLSWIFFWSTATNWAQWERTLLGRQWRVWRQFKCIAVCVWWTSNQAHQLVTVGRHGYGQGANFAVDFCDREQMEWLECSHRTSLTPHCTEPYLMPLPCRDLCFSLFLVYSPVYCVIGFTVEFAVCHLLPWTVLLLSFTNKVTSKH